MTLCVTKKKDDRCKKGFVFLCTFTGFTEPYDNLQARDHGMGISFDDTIEKVFGLWASHFARRG